MRHWKTEFAMAVDAINGTTFSIDRMDRIRKKRFELNKEAREIVRNRERFSPEQVRWAMKWLKKS